MYVVVDLESSEKKHFCNGFPPNSYFICSFVLIILVQQPLSHALQNGKVILVERI